MKLTISFLVLVFLSLPAQALSYKNKNHTTSEVITDQLIVFSGHTLGYILTQPDTIRNEGSWKEYGDNFGHFRFDSDNTAWNFVGHTYTGVQVYLYYRSRGYIESKALFYSFLSSLYFEVFIENYTEKPSIQDIFHTPFFGSSLGYLMERASMSLINSDNRFNQILGRIINPFSYLIEDDSRASVYPIIGTESYGLAWSYRL